MSEQDWYPMWLVRVGPSLVEQLERWLTAAQHRAVVVRLRQFREELAEGLADEESWTDLVVPLPLILADICDALALTEAEKAAVLGQTGQGALAEVLETRVTLRPTTVLNERQAKALKYAREHGHINHSIYQQFYPDLSGEALRLDLADLVAQGVFRKHGNCRGTYYTLAV